MDDFLLDPWLVQPSLHQLRRGDEVRPVGPKVMGLLVCLAERAGRAVTKEELLDHVWQGTFTTDESLTTAIYELRKALDDDARSPRFVGTVRGQGYRLLGEVLPLGPDEPEDQEPPRSALGLGSRLVGPAVALLVAGTVAAGITFWGTPELESGIETTPAAFETATPGRSEPLEEPAFAGPRSICSVVVQPLDSLGGDPESAVFAQGLSEQLAHDLAQGGSLAVVPGYSSAIDRLSSDPSTDAVVEGSVQPSGDRLWIRLQMVDTFDGRLLWGGTYDHRPGDSLDLQHELSREITGQILRHVEPDARCAGPGEARPGPRGDRSAR